MRVGAILATRLRVLGPGKTSDNLLATGAAAPVVSSDDSDASSASDDSDSEDSVGDGPGGCSRPHGIVSVVYNV